MPTPTAYPDYGAAEAEAASVPYHIPYGHVYVLTAADITIEGYVINTDSFLINSEGNSGIMGFAREVPPDDIGTGYTPETGAGSVATSVTGEAAPVYGVEELGFTAGTKDDADIEGSSLIDGSVGLGYIPMTTHYMGYDSQAHLFFNYSNMSKEATFEFFDDEVKFPESEGMQGYAVSDNPITYGRKESGAIQNKFGYSTTLEAGPSTNLIYNAIAASINEMVNDLVTTFPLSKQTFKRTKPLKIRALDINVLTAEEAGQTTTTTTTAPTTTTTTPTTGY
tara:strand:+ start:2087 stop:2926 length:840 start_codon:yes stop_codon:yes gene_type:complete